MRGLHAGLYKSGRQQIQDVKYQIRGCPASIAVASVMTEPLSAGPDDALLLTDEDVVEALDGLPEESSTVLSSASQG